MRSQTIIAAAIAVAVCLVSGALVYASGKDGGTKVKRVVSSGQQEAESRASGAEAGSRQGIIKSCGEEVGVGPETSCALGLEVWREAQGSSEPLITVTDPDSGQELSLRCESGGASASILCSGDDTTVYLASR